MIQTQQNTFVLFTSFKLTLDECKTLTKISTCKTSHNHSSNQRTPLIQKRAVCIVRGKKPVLHPLHPGVLPHPLTVPLPQDCCAFWLVPVSIMVEVTLKWTAWLPPCIFCIWCMTILGIPGWASTEDMQPKLQVKAHVSCNPSHQVWIVRTLGKGNTLSYQRVFSLDSYVHVQAGMAHVTIHLGGKDGLG